MWVAENIMTGLSDRAAVFLTFVLFIKTIKNDGQTNFKNNFI